MFIHLPAERRRRLLRLAAAALTPGGTVVVVGYDSTHVASPGQGGP